MRGEFNVPIGTKTKIVFESDDYKAMSIILGRVDIKCTDFEEIVSQGREGDFIFVDPPYTVKHNYNGFLKYNERIFSWGDQERLAKSLIEAASRGCTIVVTNADHESVRALYRGKVHYHSVERASVLASNSARRGFVTEAIFTFNM
jgi:DNA adenine methylase